MRRTFRPLLRQPSYLGPEPCSRSLGQAICASKFTRAAGQMFEIGSTLREARTRRELTLRDAQEATRIRLKHLAALEDERFDQLPEEVYVKGFLRAYADYLGLED